mmetsp:Transcript_22999/g.57738  ORF Transcript_22999/g.57738 Transcript_22999/m.57738 type:complete len:221 (+) Transcript_22999:292-954(+)
MAPARRRSTTTAVRTSAVSLVSHLHGRQRRSERGIERRELQAAVKYGRREPAKPGPDGELRWRYTHKEVAYITDETSRHEITSWRVQEPKVSSEHSEPPRDIPDYAAHVLLVVDLSGSMRKQDVPGFSNRAQAVYMCVARDLLGPLLSGRQLDDQTKVVVSIIEMRDEADVVLNRVGMDDGLRAFVDGRSKEPRARSHGNYIPALQAVRQLLRKDEGGLA